MADTQGNDNTCVVCFKNVLYYSIGECDHPVCYECSTRMRVLCLQNECPICRQALSRVLFTESILPYKELRTQVLPDKLFERQFKIGFGTEKIKQAYELLLENRCAVCEKLSPFRSFTTLSDHMRKVHERYFCDLCVKHLKIFTNERRCYTRQELAHHRRKGDLDNTSHRGHPLCEFCEERFMDADELYRHLRKEHLYCHLCDADGRNYYYASHQALAQHFRTDHYLCEEGECAGQHLTAVFRSEIDLKAHKASIHGKGLARAAARQARTLELQFNITPHPVAQRTPRQPNHHDTSPPSPPPAAPAPRIDTRSDEHFPRLSAAAPAPLLLGPNIRHNRGGEALARNDKNFPTLGGGGGGGGSSRGSAPSPAPSSASNRPAAPVAAAILRNAKPNVSIQLHSQPASASNFRLTQASGNRISIPPPRRRPSLDDDDFPSLGLARDDHPSIGASSMQPPKVTLINSQEMQALKTSQPTHQAKKAPMSSEAFPALSSSATPTAPPQWIKVSKNKEKARANKPEPPQPKAAAFNPVADFPTLPVNNKPKTKKAAQPSPPSTLNEIKLNKKEKKKSENAKKENIVKPTTNGETKKLRGDSASVLANVTDNLSGNVDEPKIKIKTAEASEEKKRGGNGDFTIAPSDYPPLSVNTPAPKKILNGSVPPGFSKPRPTCNGMTFTNSSGQTFSAPLHSYIPPTDFENRNRALVKQFASALGGTAAFEDFKVASRAFRDSHINANEFYQHCKSALGSQLDVVFPELVALLPDIAKQQELVVGRKAGSQLEVCSTCGQLLSPSDKIPHDTAHWPPLAPR